MRKQIIQKIEEEHLERLNTLFVVFDNLNTYLQDQGEDEELFEDFGKYVSDRILEEIKLVSSLK